MQLGIFAKTFPGDTPAKTLGAVQAAGYACAQYNMSCSGLPSMPDDIAPGVADDIAAAGVPIAALSGTYNMIHPDIAVRDAGHRKLSVLAGTCGAIGTDLITLCTGTRDAKDQWRGHHDNDTPEAWRDLVAAMEIAIGIAEAHDIYLGIEPELANVVNSAATARKLIDQMQSNRLRIVLDPANLFETATRDDQRRIVSDAIDLLGDRISMGHAKDRTPDGGFTVAGKGVLDYDHYLSALKGTGFDGPIITHGLDATDAPGVASFLRNRLGALGL